VEKSIFLAGASGTIGQELVKFFIEEGTKVIAIDKNISALRNLKEELPTNCSDLLEYHKVDLLDEATVSNLFANIEIPKSIINCVYPRNKSYGKDVTEVDLKSFSENISMHVGAYFCLTKHACMHFSKNGGGSVINFASIYGSMAPKFEIYQGTNMTTPVEYAAIKAGIIQMSRFFAKKYIKNGVRVNTISPGGILDGQDESFLQKYKQHCGDKGMLGVRDIFGLTKFLSGKDGAYITGQDLVVDDGFCL
jgi:NAD(P)-dependent dehydrogenase (short-subunit alcohol dehydrogenase family)